MPIPNNLDSPEDDILSEAQKALIIINRLCYRNYDIDTVREAVNIIESSSIDTSDFDFPYGSFEEFKKHTLAGEFDFPDIDCLLLTETERKELDQAVKEGRLWITH